MRLNLQNVEQIIFMDGAARRLLPDFKHLFDSWMLATKVTALRNLGKRSLLDFLNGLQPDHINTLSEYFREQVIVDRMDYHIVRNLETGVAEAGEVLSKYEGFLDLATYRKGDRLYISLWR